MSQPHTANPRRLEGEPKRSSSSSGTATAEHDGDCAEQLSRFFPHATPIRIPVQVTMLRRATPRLREATVLEFSGPEHAIFLCTLPLELDDPVRLEHHADRCIADATVVAVQYHQGRKAVAVKFLQPPCDWVTRP